MRGQRFALSPSFLLRTRAFGCRTWVALALSPVGAMRSEGGRGGQMPRPQSVGGPGGAVGVMDTLYSLRLLTPPLEGGVSTAQLAPGAGWVFPGGNEGRGISR